MKVSVSNESFFRKHKPNQIEITDRLAILILLHVDDGATPFRSRMDTILGTQMCVDVMAKFGLIVYTGKDVKESKTKAIVFQEQQL